jgi:hypothetical protein
MGVHYDVSCAYAHDVEQRAHWTFSGEWSLGNAGPWDWNSPDYTNFLRNNGGGFQKCKSSSSICWDLLKNNDSKVFTTWLDARCGNTVGFQLGAGGLFGEENKFCFESRKSIP